jgi:hypothetical protein
MRMMRSMEIYKIMANRATTDNESASNMDKS